MYARTALLCVSLLVLLYGQQIVAQETTTIEPDTKLALCNETDSIDFDPTEFAGVWYELARNPAPVDSLLCAQLNLTVLANNVLNISFTYSNTPLYPWVNQTMYANVTLKEDNTDGYNITYEMYGKTYPKGTFKLLEVNYTDYAFVCGYSNVTDNSTYFGIVLTRNRFVSTQQLNSYEGLAAESYANFLNGSMASIGQTTTCLGSGAVSTVQLVSTLLAFCYALLALLC